MLVGADGVSTPIGERYEEAAIDLLEGNYAAAVDGFKEIINRASADAPKGAELSTRARRGWAEALAAEGHVKRALELIERDELAASTPTLLAVAGRLKLRGGDLKGAEAEFREALVLDPEHVESLVRLGETLEKQGRVAEAERFRKQIIPIYQNMTIDDVEATAPEVFVEMGVALIGLNRYKEANDVMFIEAQEKDEINPSLLMEQGRALMAKYNYPQSRDCMRDLIDINPRNADALAVLADNYLVDFQVGTKRYNLAEKYLNRALAVNPQHAEAHLVRGVLTLSDGYTSKAREDFERSVKLNPSSMRARGLLATCDYLDGHLDKVDSGARAALEINPRGAEFFHTIAVAIEQKFRYADVVKFCDRALEVDPYYWPAYATLGVNCMRVGEDNRGRALLAKSREHDTFNPWVLNTRKLMRHMDKNHRGWQSPRFSFRVPKPEYHVLKTYLEPLLEEALDSLSKRYKVELKLPIFIESFSEHRWFSARTIGLEGLAAAGACFGNLVTLTTPNALPGQNWGAVAWHEFAHVITLGLTDNRVPRWLTEGLSVYEEGHDRPRWARNFSMEVADAYGSGRLLPISELDFGFSKPKYPNQILMSYFQGCLIVQYIEKKWNFASVLSILKGYREHKPLERIFSEVLEVTLEEFDKGFFAFVDAWVRENGYQPALAEDVIEPLELAVETAPDDLAKLADLAWAYFLNIPGKEEDSWLTAQKILKQDPDHGDAHAILAFVSYTKRDDKDEAKRLLQLALSEGTKFQFRTHFMLGQIAAEEERFDEAIEYYEKAKSIAPRVGAAYSLAGPNVYYQLAALYEKQGKSELVVERLEELSAHAPEDPKCRFAIAEHFLPTLEKDEMATEKVFLALSEAIYIAPYDPKLHIHLARAAEKLNRHDVTIREHLYLLSQRHTNPKISHLALAKAYLHRENLEEAERYARKVLLVDPEEVEAKDVLRHVKALKG